MNNNIFNTNCPFGINKNTSTNNCGIRMNNNLFFGIQIFLFLINS